MLREALKSDQVAGEVMRGIGRVGGNLAGDQIERKVKDLLNQIPDEMVATGR